MAKNTDRRHLSLAAGERTSRVHLTIVPKHGTGIGSAESTAPAPSAANAESSSTARIKPSQRQAETAALEEALSLLGFNPKLLCHFLWSKKAAALRLALSCTDVDLPADEVGSTQRCLQACRAGTTHSHGREASRG
jgi:hypothetical protein